MASVKKLKTCPKGHPFYKSSDCPVCPICEKVNKPADGFLSLIGAPARRALVSLGAGSLEFLAGYTEKEILQLHGMGPSAMRTLRQALSDAGLSFRK